MSAPLYVLLHIPKTAGQTIRRHLGAHCPPGVFWEPIGRRAVTTPPAAPERVRAVSSHEIGRSLERFFPAREIRRAALLREPISLQVSLYNYRMMNYLARGQGTCGFALHLRSLPRDFITHRLLSGWLEVPRARLLRMSPQQKYELANRMLAGFWFVGDYTLCPRLIRAIAADLGIPEEAQPQNTWREWHRQVEWRPLHADDLSPAQRAQILARNPVDRALWETWRDAGLATDGVRPVPLGAGRTPGPLDHELIRPAFVAAKLWRRFGPRGRVAGTAGADRARDAGEWARAARLYRRALAAAPNRPAIWVQYGHALKELGRVAEAEAAYRRSLVLDPDMADTHLQLGHALKLLGRGGEAAEAYLRALALDPELPGAHGELAGLGWDGERVAAAVAPAASGNRGCG